MVTDIVESSVAVKFRYRRTLLNCHYLALPLSQFL